MTLVRLKKQKAKKMCVIKRKLQFRNYENCLEAAQLDNKTNHLEKKFDIDSLTKSIKNS